MSYLDAPLTEFSDSDILIKLGKIREERSLTQFEVQTFLLSVFDVFIQNV